MTLKPTSLAEPADGNQDRETRMRFMHIDAETGETLREFWNKVDGALPEILEGFYQHVTKEPQLAKLVGSDIPRTQESAGLPLGAPVQRPLRS